jgi:hypothetical protein
MFPGQTVPVFAQGWHIHFGPERLQNHLPIVVAMGVPEFVHSKM